MDWLGSHRPITRPAADLGMWTIPVLGLVLADVAADPISFPCIFLARRTQAFHFYVHHCHLFLFKRRPLNWPPPGTGNTLELQQTSKYTNEQAKNKNQRGAAWVLAESLPLLDCPLRLPDWSIHCWRLLRLLSNSRG